MRAVSVPYWWQWLEVTAALGYYWYPKRKRKKGEDEDVVAEWDMFRSNTAIDLERESIATSGWYRNHGYTVLTFEEWKLEGK